MCTDSTQVSCRLKFHVSCTLVHLIIMFMYIYFSNQQFMFFIIIVLFYLNNLFLSCFPLVTLQTYYYYYCTYIEFLQLKSLLIANRLLKIPKFLILFKRVLYTVSFMYNQFQCLETVYLFSSCLLVLTTRSYIFHNFSWVYLSNKRFPSLKLCIALYSLIQEKVVYTHMLLLYNIQFFCLNLV